MSVFAFLFYVVFGLVMYLFYSSKRKLNYWQSRGIPCEEPNWFLGNITGIQTKRCFADLWISYYNKFKGTGPFAGFYWFQKPAVFVLDTKLAKNILIKDFNKFVDRGFYSNPKDDPLTGHLFLLRGHKWRRMRNKLTPSFTMGKIKAMVPIIMKVGKEFINVFEDMMKQNSVIEVKDILARFTIDVIGTCAFGINCCSLRDPQAEFLIMGKKSIRELPHGQLLIAFMNTFPIISRKLHLKHTLPQVEEFFFRIVRETIAYREKYNISRKDFMDMLIQLKNNKLIRSEDGEILTNLTLKEIAAQAFVFFSAGFEAASSTMGFVLYELALHENIQQRTREEVLNILEKHNQELTYECLCEMKYLDQVICETLRLYTSLPVLNRDCIEDYEVPGNPKYVIKKGMHILIPTGAIHRDPDYYPNPDAFNPENFSDEKVKQRDSIEYLPFGEGPRNCIGMRFGQMQMRIGLSLLIKHFKFSVCPETQIPLKFSKKSYLLSLESGLYLQVEKI